MCRRFYYCCKKRTESSNTYVWRYARKDGQTLANSQRSGQQSRRCILSALHKGLGLNNHPRGHQSLIHFLYLAAIGFAMIKALLFCVSPERQLRHGANIEGKQTTNGYKYVSRQNTHTLGQKKTRSATRINWQRGGCSLGSCACSQGRKTPRSNQNIDSQ